MLDYEALMLNKPQDHRLRDGFLSLGWLLLIVAAIAASAHFEPALDTWTPAWARGWISPPILVGTVLSIASIIVNWVLVAGHSWKLVWIDIRKYVVILGVLALAEWLLPTKFKELVSVEGFTAVGFLIYRISDLANDVATMGTYGLLYKAFNSVRPSMRKKFDGVTEPENSSSLIDMIFLRACDNAIHRDPERRDFYIAMFWIARESKDARVMLNIAHTMERLSYPNTEAQTDIMKSFIEKYRRESRWHNSHWA